MKKEMYIIAGVIILVVAIVLGFIFIKPKDKKPEVAINNSEDMINMVNHIYEHFNQDLPKLDTQKVDVKNLDDVIGYTGLQSNQNIEELVVSEPMMSSQAYSLVVIKVKDGSDIEKLKQEMLDNLNMRKWICVSAEKLYITNSKNIIFSVMGKSDVAQEAYQGFKKYVYDEIGKELEKTYSE